MHIPLIRGCHGRERERERESDSKRCQIFADIVLRCLGLSRSPCLGTQLKAEPRAEKFPLLAGIGLRTLRHNLGNALASCGHVDEASVISFVYIQEIARKKIANHRTP